MSELRIYNTLTRTKDTFKPIDPNHVRMYVCGPTVYDYAHVGNARPVIVFDTFYRLLKRQYPKVTYARNITDIDDKILARAKERGISIKELTIGTTKKYHDDMGHLNALRPDEEPRATDFIPQMINLTKTLVDKGFAYEAEGHVLFSVKQMDDYGKLSRRTRDELIAGARVEIAPYKKDPADFVLWKPAPEGGEGWESPWGYGRPGWHLECSAMADELLGTTFDIHGGGLDLIFPHHENEIAQSTCAHNGTAPANYWMHNGFLMVNGEKMSKSLGNFYTVHDLLEKTQGETIRLNILSTHYRQPCDFTDKGLKEAKAILDKWYGALRNASEVTADDLEVFSKVEDALLDDLNVPLAISEIHNLVGQLNKATDLAEKAKLKSQIIASGNALGLLEQEAESWLKGGATTDGPSDEEIESLIQKRIDAKKAKDFITSDKIRDDLAAVGIVLEDSPQGTTWRRG